jgi:hypothetical protein
MKFFLYFFFFTIAKILVSFKNTIMMIVTITINAIIRVLITVLL